MSCYRLFMPRQILDSRGNPTIEVDVLTENEHLGRAVVSMGASTGGYMKRLNCGMATKTVWWQKRTQSGKNVNTLLADNRSWVGMANQTGIDAMMIALDGTSNKPEPMPYWPLVWLATGCRPGSECTASIGGTNARIPPILMMNIYQRGAHADNKIDFQEFMIMPVGASSFSEGLQWGVEIFPLKSVLKKKGYSTNV